MTKKRKKARTNKLPWVLDECISPKEENWKIGDNDQIYSLGKLNLLSIKDRAISSELINRFPKGKIILTRNKKPDKRGDYFDLDKKTCIVKLSNDLETAELQQQHYKKFRKMVKNESKLLGSVATLSRANIIYKKGSKTKEYKYNDYI